LVVTSKNNDVDGAPKSAAREDIMNHRTRHSVGAALLAITAVGLSATAVAQTTPPAEKPNDDEIVVTAQKRSERLQDVPLAVSAVTAESLTTAGVASATDLRYVSPSVNYGSSANTRGEGLQIRGVGTQIFGDGVEQSVGVVVDGVPMGRNGQGIADLVDVQRLEVLRGPQGMLFGKNASAGVISVITNEPRLGETSLALRGSYATLDDKRWSAVGNVAMGDNSALRVAYAGRQREGYVDNIVRREKLNDVDNQSFRVRFLTEPSDAFRFLLTADWDESSTTCCTWTARSAPPATTFGLLNGLSGIAASPTNLRNAAGARFFQDQTNWGISGQAEMDLGWATLTGIAAYRYWNAEDNNDPDILPINVLDRNFGDSTVDQNTFEVRLASPGDSKLEWIVGLFRLDMTNEGGNVQAGTLGLALPPGGTLGSERRSTTENTSNAIFGQIGYNLTDQFKVIAGARYTDETLSVDWTQRQASGTIGMFPGRFVGSASASRGTTNTSWRLTAQYDFTDDVMAYATAARGYKGPAYDQDVRSTTVLFAQPEIPTTYEAGFRSRVFGGTTIFNAAAFTTTFKNFQAQVFDQNQFPSRFITANAGELETKGVELEFRSRPVEGLTLSGNAAYVDATYTDFKNVACWLGQPQQAFGTPRTSPRQCIANGAPTLASPLGTNFTTEATGNPLTNSPELTGNVAINYERPIGGLLGFVGANYYYRDDVTFSAAGDPNTVQKAYGLIGAQIGIGGADDSWRLTIFGRNLGDENFVNNIIGQPVLGAAGVYSQFPSADARRIVGVSLDVKFGGS
jgi:iron complex outermembrane receptor protein